MAMNDDYLAHYGVKGMKWGVRKKSLPVSSTRAKYDEAKADYKDAKKAYSKSYAKAYNGSIGGYSPIKKHRDNSRQRWEEAYRDAGRANEAKKAYKQARRERKSQIKDTHKSLNKSASVGEKLVYNSATRKKAAKYVIDNDMTVAEATKRSKKEAMRNTALFMAAYGAMSVGALAYAKYR